MKSLIFLCLVGYSMAAIGRMRVKEGERLELDLGNQIKTWTRTRNGSAEESIRYCGPTEKGINCAQFVGKDGKVIEPVTESAKVDANGILSIEKVKKSDAGSYFSYDQPERVINHEDGSYGKLPRSVLVVEVV